MFTYLIDFENVNDIGMNGIHALQADDQVYIIYTDNANRISLDWFDGVRASISVVKVTSGDQSLDKHLVSFLGYLLGQETEDDRRYVIVSKDKGYADIASFWCNRYGNNVKVVVQPTVSGQNIQNVRGTLMSNQGILRQRISSIMTNHGVYGEYGKMMLLATLCAYLNNEASFQSERDRTGLKGMKLLALYDDVIQIIHYNKTEWVVLVDKADPLPLVPDDDINIECPGDVENETSSDSDTDVSFELDSSIENLTIDELDNTSIDADSDSSAPLFPDENNCHDEDSDSEQIDAEEHALLSDQILLPLIEKGATEEEAKKIVCSVKEIEPGSQRRIAIYHKCLKVLGRKRGTEIYRALKWVLG